MGGEVDDRPWWLWPNLLALDAPVVAVVWQQFLAAAAGVRVPVVAAVVLGLVVWGVYLGDRWLDARRGVRTTDRHRFTAEYLRATGVVAVVALLAAAVLATRLPERYLEVGGVAALTLAGYFVIVHATPEGLLPGAKEATVGLVFGSGVAIPLIADSSSLVTAWLSGVVAFAGLCWLNCALINKWEERPPDAPPRWAILFAAGLAIAAAVVAGPPTRTPILASTGLLALLHLARSRVPTRVRRVLADLVLLTPLVAGVCP